MGYTPLTDSSKHYNTWYHVALKIREFDFVGEVCFGVVTSEDLAIDLGVNSVPSARLMLWNDTKVSTIIPTFVLPKKNFIQNELLKFNSILLNTFVIVIEFNNFSCHMAYNEGRKSW